MLIFAPRITISWKEQGTREHKSSKDPITEDLICRSWWGLVQWRSWVTNRSCSWIGLRPVQCFTLTLNSCGTHTKTSTEGPLRSNRNLLCMPLVLAQSWGYSGSGNQGEKSKATLATRSEKGEGQRVYKNQVEKNNKIIISGIKPFRNTVVVQEIISCRCRVQALKLFSGSHCWWVDPLPPSYHSMYWYNVQWFKILKQTNKNLHMISAKQKQNEKRSTKRKRDLLNIKMLNQALTGFKSWNHQDLREWKGPKTTRFRAQFMVQCQQPTPNGYCWHCVP